MTCEKFHARYNRWLDERRADPPPDELVDHMGVCARCSGYALALRRLDTALRDLPEVTIPARLDAVGLPSRGVKLASRLRAAPGRGAAAAAALLAPPVAAIVATQLVPPAWSALPPFTLATAGLFLAAFTTLRPRFIE